MKLSNDDINLLLVAIGDSMALTEDCMEERTEEDNESMVVFRRELGELEARLNRELRFFSLEELKENV